MNSDIWAQWLTAIGTVGATVVALWFGLKGNRQFRAVIKQERKKLDAVSFKFLSTIMTKKGAEQEQYSIGQYEKTILDCPYIGEIKSDKYFNYRDLAKLACDAAKTNKDDLKKIFDKIKKEAESLAKLVDNPTRLEFMQLIWNYEAREIWRRNLVKITPREQFGPHRKVLVYTDVRDNNTFLENVLNTINADFKKRNRMLENDNFYEDEGNSDCSQIFPVNENYQELIYRDKNKIKIKYRYKIITLHYNEARSYNELGLYENDIVL